MLENARNILVVDNKILAVAEVFLASLVDGNYGKRRIFMKKEGEKYLVAW